MEITVVHDYPEADAAFETTNPSGVTVYDKVTGKQIARIDGPAAREIGEILEAHGQCP